MNLRVEKTNAGNKIIMKSYGKLLINHVGVWKYNCCKKKQNIHIRSCWRTWLELIKGIQTKCRKKIIINSNETIMVVDESCWRVWKYKCSKKKRNIHIRPCWRMLRTFWKKSYDIEIVQSFWCIIKKIMTSIPIKSGDNAEFPPQPPGSLVMWGTEWPKCNIFI